MALVKIEAEEDHGDPDSNCSAAKAGELFSSVLELASDQHEIAVLEDNDDILCDTPHNMIKIKRGLAPEVLVHGSLAEFRISPWKQVYKQVMAAELLHFDMAVVQDSVLGGSNSAIYHRWNKGKSNYDKEILAGAITHTRWLQIKRVYKICDNDLAPKKGDADYDPIQIQLYLYKYLIHNISKFIQLVDLDLCSDKTTCGHGGFGKAGFVTSSQANEKAWHNFWYAETVLVSDLHRNRTRAYTHCHKV
jgi:hypothetical protein